MGFFPFDLKKVAIFAVLIAVPLLAINIKRKEGHLRFFLKPFFSVAGFAQEGAIDFSQGIRSTVDLYINLVNIKKDNRVYKKKIEELQANLSQFQEVKGENERLAQLLDFKKSSPHQLVAARVIGHDLLGQHSSLYIDKGSDDGITPGQAVITPLGVVGSVLTVDKKFAQILTLTDRYSDIDSVVERSRARGVIEGASPLCRLKYLQRTDDVQVGDNIVTTGLDRIFPKGFPIGKVIRVEKKDYGITQDVQVEPLVSSFDVEFVFVVAKTNDKAEVQEKIKEINTKE